jgi:hypothetical protein
LPETFAMPRSPTHPPHNHAAAFRKHLLEAATKEDMDATRQQT